MSNTTPPVIENKSPSIPNSAHQKPKRLSVIHLAGIVIFAPLILLLLLIPSQSKQKEGQSGEMAREIAGESNPIVQKIKGLNGGNAYVSGMRDGTTEIYQALLKRPGAQDLERFSTKANLKDLKNAWFDLVQTQNQFDQAVFNAYRQGWNDGADSVQ